MLQPSPGQPLQNSFMQPPPANIYPVQQAQLNQPMALQQQYSVQQAQLNQPMALQQQYPVQQAQFNQAQPTAAQPEQQIAASNQARGGIDLVVSLST